jgi:hypothetical protein
MPTTQCPICKGKDREARHQQLGERDGKPFHITQIQCRNCGDYRISDRLISKIELIEFSPRQIANITSWLSEWTNDGEKIEILDVDLFEFLQNIPTPTFHERADKLLLNIEKETDFGGHLIEILGKIKMWWQRRAWALNDTELTTILGFLESEKRIERDVKRSLSHYWIAPAGWAHLETLKKVNTDSVQGFVAMNFVPELFHVYEHAIEKAIRDAGYKPYMVGREDFQEKIDDKIIAEVRRSRFVVADCTNDNSNVFYEAGFAAGLNIPVIWTGKDIENEDEKLELRFDTRQYPHVLWKPDNLDDFRDRLTNRIARVIGWGPEKPPET